MKYLKRFNESESEISDYISGTYTVNGDGSIDVVGDVILEDSGISKLPIKFNNINGNFYCYENSLTSLEGSPVEVIGFYCGDNELTSLEFCPSKVSSHFECHGNELTSLVGCPKTIGGYFNCNRNNLTSLEGCPEYINGNLNCTYNNLYNFYGIGKVSGNIFSDNNPVNEILDLCPTVFTQLGLKEFIGYLNEFRPIRGKSILGKRLQECLYMCDIEIDVTTLTFKNYTLLE